MSASSQIDALCGEVLVEYSAWQQTLLVQSSTEGFPLPGSLHYGYPLHTRKQVSILDKKPLSTLPSTTSSYNRSFTP